MSIDLLPKEEALTLGLEVSRLDLSTWSDHKEGWYEFAASVRLVDTGGDGAEVSVSGALHWSNGSWSIDHLDQSFGGADDLVWELLNYKLLDRLPAPPEAKLP